MSLARVRALIIVGVLVVCATVLVAISILKDRQAGLDLTENCAAGAIPVDMTLPAKPEDIKVKVFNSTDSPGLASQVVNDFKSRKITVAGESNEKQPKNQFVALLRYGPKVVGTAWLVNAYFFNKATPMFDPNRKDDIVDVVLGTDFRQLGSTTEVNQSLANAGKPQLPPGTCDSKAQ
jgi:hypothetical protein